jgi:hypothetical protein
LMARLFGLALTEQRGDLHSGPRGPEHRVPTKPSPDPRGGAVQGAPLGGREARPAGRSAMAQSWSWSARTKTHLPAFWSARTRTQGPDQAVSGSEGTAGQGAPLEGRETRPARRSAMAQSLSWSARTKTRLLAFWSARTRTRNLSGRAEKPCQEGCPAAWTGLGTPLLTGLVTGVQQAKARNQGAAPPPAGALTER